MRENNISSGDKRYLAIRDTDKEVVFTIEAATEENIAEIAKIEAECFSEPWSEKSFRDALRLSSA